MIEVRPNKKGSKITRSSAGMFNVEMTEDQLMLVSALLSMVSCARTPQFYPELNELIERIDAIAGVPDYWHFSYDAILPDVKIMDSSTFPKLFDIVV